mgnify:CR=1 FL=1
MPETFDWIDPRPPLSGRRLAPRPGCGTPRHLVFFDNSKLSPPYDRWIPVVPPVLACLEGLGRVQREYSDLLLEPVAQHAERVAPLHPDAASRDDAADPGQPRARRVAVRP